MESPTSFERLWIQLGRYGDIINILPLLRREKEMGRPYRLLIAKPFASVLEGVGYVEPVIWDNQFHELVAARKWAEQSYREIVVSQVYGEPFIQRCDNFMMESWGRADRLQWWGRLPMVFDRRDQAREKKLFDLNDNGKPMILIARNGHSSPFPYRGELWNSIDRAFGSFCNLVDLDRVTGERIYDLLGLYDRAACLVSIDTAHLHLARASNVPVIALITDGPTQWHGSPRYPNHVVHRRYSEFPGSRQEILDAIQESLRMNKKFTAPVEISQEPVIPPAPINPGPSPLRTMVHVWSDYTRSGDTQRRHEFAKKTWNDEFNGRSWVSCPITEKHLGRDSRKILGDHRAMPFIRDIIQLGLSKCPFNGILVLTNDDICFAPGISEELLKVDDAHACWANRWDFGRLNEPKESWQVKFGQWCVGSDLFAFTPKWWLDHQHQVADFVLGCECWDMVFREVIRNSGGFELHAMIYHEFHHSFWWQGNNRHVNPGNQHNQRMAIEWLEAHNMPLKELEFLKPSLFSRKKAMA